MRRGGVAKRRGCVRTSSSRIFCTMKVATVLESSEPISMVRRQSGMISVLSRKLITPVSSTCFDVSRGNAGCERCCVAARQCGVAGGGVARVGPRGAACAAWRARRAPGGRRTLTRAPMTPRLVRRRYSNGRVLDTVLRKG